MKALILALILLCLPLASTAYAAEGCGTDVKSLPALTKPLERGVNLSRWWEDERDRPIDTDDLARIHALGFDFVRLPISPAWLEITDNDDRNEKLAQMRCDILTLIKSGLKVVVDLHPKEAFDEEFNAMEDAQRLELLESLWHAMLPVLADVPPQDILLDLYNEPQLGTDDWWDLQGRLIADIRRVYPVTTLIASASPSAGWWQFAQLEPYADSRIVYDFHFYAPMILTHHGAEWFSSNSPYRDTDDIFYPAHGTMDDEQDNPAMRRYVAKDWSRKDIRSIIAEAVTWRAKNHVTLLCLEFGIYKAHVDEKSRNNWLGDTRTELEKASIPWALWEYEGPFGLVDARGTLDENMAKTLGLGHTPPP